MWNYNSSADHMIRDSVWFGESRIRIKKIKEQKPNHESESSPKILGFVCSPNHESESKLQVHRITNHESESKLQVDRITNHESESKVQVDRITNHESESKLWSDWITNHKAESKSQMHQKQNHECESYFDFSWTRTTNPTVISTLAMP